MSHAPSCLTALYLLVGTSIQDGEKYWELLMACRRLGRGRHKEERGGARLCEEQPLYG